MAWRGVKVGKWTNRQRSDEHILQIWNMAWFLFAIPANPSAGFHIAIGRTIPTIETCCKLQPAIAYPLPHSCACLSR